MKTRVQEFEELAAVAGRFEPQDLFAADDAPAIREAVLNRAVGNFTVETTGGRVRWIMRPAVRAAALRGLSEAGRLKAVLQRQLPATDDYGTLLRLALSRGPKLSLRRRSPDDLRCLRLIAEDLAAAGLPAPDAAEIERTLDAGAFVREFLTLDGPFVGRKRELSTLRDFLTAAPKSSPGWTAMVLSGLGGAGKSALLARFLRGVHRDRTANLVVFDFDRPGIDAADTVWLRTEMARQIGLQYPEVADQLREARRTLRRGRDWAAQQSNAGLESLGYAQATDDLLFQIRVALKDAGVEDRPVLMVLDTLEILSSSDSQNALLSWIDTVSNILAPIPLKVLFSGRLFDNSLAPFLDRAGDPVLHLDVLPVGASRRLLSKSGVPAGLAEALARSDWLPRRPLELRLLARLAIDGRVSVDSLERDLRAGSRELSAGIIYRRVLARLGSGLIGRIAAPGLILRFVTPGLIRDVLGPALDLPSMTEVEARLALDELAGHSWLVTLDGPDRVRHRRDLRRSMLKLMIEDSAGEARKISDLAVPYFGTGPSAVLAEAMYHRLLWIRQPEDGAGLALADLNQAYSSIEPDIDDLPPAAAALMRFASLPSVPASDVVLLPVEHFLSAYKKTGQRLVRNRELGQAIRFLDRREALDRSRLGGPTTSPALEWELEALFGSAQWERLSALLLRDGTMPDHPISSGQLEAAAKSFYYDAVLLSQPLDSLQRVASRLLDYYVYPLPMISRPEGDFPGLNPLAMGLLLVKPAVTLHNVMKFGVTALLDRHERSRNRSRSAVLNHRLQLLTLAYDLSDPHIFHLAPSLLPLRRELLDRMAHIEKLRRARDLFEDLLQTVESQAERKQLTTRAVLSVVDSLYKHEDLWQTVSLKIGRDIDPDLLRGPDLDFRDPVRYCLLEEFADDAGRRELAGIIQAHIDLPLADLDADVFSGALALDAEHTLVAPVELVDRSWRLGAFLDAVVRIRPNSTRLGLVHQAHKRWGVAVEAALNTR
ncbi:ATP-binding protein [Aquisphaera insulae]|uniref:ATP-binding protein n=1 Tax=Aquisphaera insulae TaxID=2712864 RepID=UPI0013E9D740|nr:ATP-binding protein [Aquisphaera insulae]